MTPDEGSSTQFGDFETTERLSAERGIAIGLMTVRTIHIAQGVIALSSGWKAYRRPKVALALLAVSIVETAWIARRAWSRRSYTDPQLAWIDTAFGVGGLIVMASTTTLDDRTDWLNWMCPFTFGTTIGGAAAIEGHRSKLIPAVLAGTYVVTVHRNIRSGGSQLATALANTTSYIGSYAAARSFGGRLREDSDKLATARQETLRERERFAAERQRNYEHRLLHDSALQTLELIAHGSALPEEELRAQARREADVLRRAISRDDGTRTSLVVAVQAVADEPALKALRVDLAVIDPNVAADDEASDALLGALREALTNVAKHAGVDRVVVSLSRDQSGIRLVVRDRGTGFDGSRQTEGFGIKQSIVGRLEDVGGTAIVTSNPGSGTRVELWIPN